MSYLEKDRKLRSNKSPDSNASSKDKSPALSEKPLPNATESTGDILTKVAIPRSGSFLNTGGLTRYKSKNNRRNLKGSPTIGGGGGGSPLGFSELFQEFRLQENLHSLDEILNAIINTDGMSYNNLKPIYKEFLLKLAVTLTKDELYQRSKSIMRRQKKKKVKKQKQQQVFYTNLYEEEYKFASFFLTNTGNETPVIRQYHWTETSIQVGTLSEDREQVKKHPKYLEIKREKGTSLSFRHKWIGSISGWTS